MILLFFICSAGSILPVSQIMSNIKYIMEDKSERPSHPLGYLTSQNRDVWAQTRDNLLASGELVCLGSSDAGYEMHEFGSLRTKPPFESHSTSIKVTT